MIRRNFIQQLAAGSAAAGLAAASTSSRQTVAFHVKGFSCITCAVGLDTVLSRESGVIHCQSDYAQARTSVEFDASKISVAGIEKLIAEMGFQPEKL